MTAPCASMWEVFFPEDDDEGRAVLVDVARLLCHGCPGRQACYEGAVARREPCGVWGGVDFGAAPATGRVLIRRVYVSGCELCGAPVGQCPQGRTKRFCTRRHQQTAARRRATARQAEREGVTVIWEPVGVAS